MTACGEREGKTRQPDVYLVTLDTTRADHLAWGSPKGVDSPALQAIAREGVVFTSAFTSVPLTLPAHAAILTGLMPQHTGLVLNFQGTLSTPETLATVFRSAGYRTGAVVSASVLDRQFGLDRGFQFYEDRRLRGKQMLERTARETWPLAQKWLDTIPDRESIFFWFHLYDPHHPYTPPPDLAAQYPDRPYDGEIAASLEAVDALIGWIKKHRRWEDCVIALVGDHGEGLWEHGEEVHGNLLYDTTLHVPAGIKLPAGFKMAPIQKEEPVSLEDIAPTLCALAGVRPALQKATGRDLTPLIQGKSFEDRPLYAVSLNPNSTMGFSPLSSVRSGRFKYIAGSREEIFLWKTDTAEAADLSRSRPELLSKLRALLASLLQENPFATGTSLTPAEMQPELRALGYLGGPPTEFPEPTLSTLQDPRDHMPAFTRITQLWGSWEELPALKVLSECDKLLKRYPRAVLVLELAAQTAYKTKSYPQALDYAQRALAAQPETLSMRLLEARVLKDTGNPARAETIVDEVLGKDPGSGEALMLKASLLISRNLPDDALALWISVLQRYPDRRDAFANWMQRRMAQGEYRKALEELEAFRNAGLRDSQYFYVRGALLSASGDAAGAEAALAQALEEPKARLLFARLQIEGKRAGRALDILKPLITSDEKIPEAFVLAGMALEDLGDLEHARLSYTAALELDPTEPSGLYNLACLELRSGRLGEAKIHFRKFLGEYGTQKRFHEQATFARSQMDR